MNNQNRIIYQPDELVRNVERKLDELKVFQFDSRYRMLLGESFAKRMSDWDRSIRDRKDDPFTLVVCGEFKRGKSSLINALLGEDVVTTNVTTETVTLNKISYGTHSNEAVLSGGRRMRLSDEDLQRDRLENLIRQAGEPICQLEIKRPIELLKQVTIIDTPGLGDAMKDFSDMVQQALRQADAVVYVFSVNYPLSQAEQLFLKTEILPQKYTELFLVGNYADMMPNQQGYERMKELLYSRIEGLLPGREFRMLSALDERCLQLGEDRPNPELQDLLGENFALFRQDLARLVEEKRDMVIPDRMQRLLRGMNEELEQMLQAMEEGLVMSSEDLRKAMDDLNEQCDRQATVQAQSVERIDEQIKNMLTEAHDWINQLLDRMQAEVNQLQGWDRNELIKYYSFYCMDTLQEAMNQCVEHHTLQVYDLLDEISEDLLKGLSKSAQKRTYNFRFALDNRTWTKGDNVSYVANFVGLSGISLIVDGIAGTMRQKELKKRAPDVLARIKEQYGSLRISALQAVEDTYLQMGENVKKQLDEFYSESLSAAKARVDQSAMVARQDEEKKEEIRAAIAHIRSVLSSTEGI